jgi:hypothetical protein
LINERSDGGPALHWHHNGSVRHDLSPLGSRQQSQNASRCLAMGHLYSWSVRPTLSNLPLLHPPMSIVRGDLSIFIFVFKWCVSVFSAALLDSVSCHNTLNNLDACHALRVGLETDNSSDSIIVTMLLSSTRFRGH